MLRVDNPGPIDLFDGFRLDLARGCVLRFGELIHIRPQTYEVLKYLAQHRGHLISKDKLIEEVWKGRAVTDGSLGKCIEELREALGPEAKQFIRNVRGRGYIFENGVEEPAESSIVPRTDRLDVVRVTVEEHEVGPEAGTLKVLPTASVRFTKFRSMVIVGAGILVLTLGIILAYNVLKNRTSTAAPITSIAVLPIRNESGNVEVEYVSDGMTESLINNLSQLTQLKVIAQNSAFQYKGKEFNPEEVSSALGVQAILTGRMTQRGEDLVVSVELIDTRDMTQVWGERYTRKATDVQAIQEEISRVISEKLRFRLTGAQEEQLTKRATRNSQAYQFYLNGLYYLRHDAFNDTLKARDYFDNAVALDANFALAWVGVAHANRKVADNSLSDPKEPLARAKTATEQALRLDNTLAEAHVELAGIKRDEWDWAKADEEYRRAIELNPNLVEAHRWYASYLSTMGRHDEALAQIKHAQELDPLGTGLINQQAWLLYLARRFDEAEAKLNYLKAINPRASDYHLRLGLIYVAKGLHEKAIEQYQRVFTADDEMPWRRIILGYALAMSGRKSEAHAILNRLKSAKQYVSSTELALLYVGLGDTESAIASLEKAYALHDPQLQYLNADLHLDPLRSDPRFQDLVRRVGLPA